MNTIRSDAFTLRQHFTDLFKAAQVMPRESFIIELVRLATLIQDADSSMTAERAAKLAYTILSGPTAVDTLSELPLAQLEREHGDAVRQHRIACAALSKAEQDQKLARQRLHDTSQEILKRNRDAHTIEHKCYAPGPCFGACCDPTHPRRRC